MNVVRVVERWRPQVQTIDAERIGQERLRQRRSLIGSLGFVAEQQHATLEAVLAQRARGLDTGLPGADDDERLTQRRAPRGRQGWHAHWCALAHLISVGLITS